MRKRWAFVTVLAALAVGATSTTLLTRSFMAYLSLSLSCVLLDEAEKAGYLSKDKRPALVDKLTGSTSLSEAERRLAQRLGSVCPQ